MIRLFVRWSGPGDPPAAPEDQAPRSTAEPPSTALAPPERPATPAWAREWIGSDVGDAIKRLGDPSMALTGLGPYASDARYVFHTDDHGRLSVTAKDGIIVSVSSITE